MSGSLKRKNTGGEFQQAKRLRVDSREDRDGDTPQNSAPTTAPGQPVSGPSKSRRQRKEKGEQTTAQTPKVVAPGGRGTIRKLAPPKPFPNVPTSVSATGPKSTHKEGQNFICVTRHTSLAAYLSRCRKLLVDGGYRILHLHAMGAAIPHLLTLTVSLPPILPFPRNEVKIEVRTSTIEVTDEIIPEDEDEDMSLRVRAKGGVSVMLQIRDGKECISAAPKNVQRGKRSEGKGKKPAVLIIREQEQDDDDEMDEDEDGDDD